MPRFYVYIEKMVTFHTCVEIEASDETQAEILGKEKAIRDSPIEWLEGEAPGSLV